ncbi:MAG TPA: DUF4268 domain-containing protein [Flavitalea sp.]|nr:DUF4268 domain-containing protein [Flavitalea sp.]
MYSRQEASHVRKEFWTALGQYLKPVLSAEGTRINWINYRTGVRHFHFRLDAIDARAFISLELDHPDTELQGLYFEQLKSMEGIFQVIMDEKWDWQQLQTSVHGKLVSRVVREIDGAKVLNRNHWPVLISFFKERIIKLDRFWTEVKDQFLYQ